MIKILSEVYAGARPALKFKSPFELLVAVVLSAQCTDRRVNEVTEHLFSLADTPEKMMRLPACELEAAIRSCGLYRAKAKNIAATCRMLVAEYGGEVPEDFCDLVRLPGVGRKTANVIRSVAFGRDAIAVDTHVFRVANRLGLARGTTPEEVEEGLMRAIPKKQWSAAHHWLIWHGRRVCKAKKPLCGECPLASLCPSASSIDDWVATPKTPSVERLKK